MTVEGYERLDWPDGVFSAGFAVMTTSGVLWSVSPYEEQANLICEGLATKGVEAEVKKVTLYALPSDPAAEIIDLLEL